MACMSGSPLLAKFRHFSLGICKSHSRTYLKLKLDSSNIPGIVWESLFSIQWVKDSQKVCSMCPRKEAQPLGWDAGIFDLVSPGYHSGKFVKKITV